MKGSRIGIGTSTRGHISRDPLIVTISSPGRARELENSCLRKPDASTPALLANEAGVKGAATEYANTGPLGSLKMVNRTASVVPYLETRGWRLRSIQS